MYKTTLHKLFAAAAAMCPVVYAPELPPELPSPPYELPPGEITTKKLGKTLLKTIKNLLRVS